MKHKGMDKVRSLRNYKKWPKRNSRVEQYDDVNAKYNTVPQKQTRQHGKEPANIKTCYLKLAILRKRR